MAQGRGWGGIANAEEDQTGKGQPDRVDGAAGVVTITRMADRGRRHRSALSRDAGFGRSRRCRRRVHQFAVVEDDSTADDLVVEVDVKLAVAVPELFNEGRD